MLLPCEPVGTCADRFDDDADESAGVRVALVVLRVMIVSAAVAAVAAAALFGLELGQLEHALAVGPTAYSKAITVNNTTTTLLRYSSTSSQAFGVCDVATSGLNVFLVDPTASDTTNGEGPYCDTCLNGPRFVIGNDYARTSAGTGTVRCRFYDAALGSADTGTGFGQGLADTLYCKLTGCTLTGAFSVAPSAAGATPLSVRTNNTTGGVNDRFITIGDAGNEYFGVYNAASTGGVRAQVNSAPLRIQATATDITTGTNEDLTLAPNGTGSVALQSGDNQVDIISSGGTTNGHLANTNTNLVGLVSNAATGGVLQASGAGAIVGRQGNAAIASTVLNVADSMTDSSGGTGLWSVDGVGITQWVTNVSANNNLVGTSACAASGDVGKVVLYNDTSTSKFTFCACEQTAAATFAWGALTAAGDCT